MSPQLALIKLRLRLNKLHSQDYDNIEDWKGVEAINKVQLEWFRKQVQGYNKIQEADEESRVKVDDIQQFLIEVKLEGLTHKYYFESSILPTNYLWFKKILPVCEKGTCQGVMLDSLFVEESNVPQLLTDWSMKPSFEWRETFHTLIGKRLRVYTNGEFDVQSVWLTYYRAPQKMDIAGYIHEDGTSSADADIEFKDDIAEIIIDEAAAVLAADTEYFTQLQALKQRSDGNS